jgi:hypothetical protein
MLSRESRESAREERRTIVSMMDSLREYEIKYNHYTIIKSY